MTSDAPRDPSRYNEELSDEAVQQELEASLGDIFEAPTLHVKILRESTNSIRIICPPVLPLL
jgi:hypothetical protein